MKKNIMRVFLSGLLMLKVLGLGACSYEDTATAPVQEKKEPSGINDRHTGMTGYEEAAQIIREAEMQILKQKNNEAAGKVNPSR